MKKQLLLSLLFVPALAGMVLAESRDYEIVTFGRYEQDGDETNGAEPIEWLLADENEEGYFYISRYGLENMPYQNDAEDTTWEKSDIRTWLNETFLNTAFTEEEAAAIIPQTISNHDNPDHGTDGGDESVDKIFLLDVQEAVRYFPDPEDRVVIPTHAAQDKGLIMVDENSLWRLRTPGRTSEHDVIVLTTGEFDYCGLNVTYSAACIRPAMWVKK